MIRRLALLLTFVISPHAGGQIPPIGIIDFYGLRTVREDQLRAALGVREGDAFPQPKAEVEQRLGTVPGVVRARISGVCCDAGRSIMFVGIEETGAPSIRFRPAPTGTVRLRDDLLRTSAALDVAAQAAILRGDAAEDQSRGHSLMHDSAARAIQERYIGFAARDSALLRDVLRNSADSAHRALAAEVIAYGTDKSAAVPELTAAMLDPSSAVRNNAMRALALIAIYAHGHPELRITVSPAPFIDMLSSPIWTDRNKSSMALMQLTEPRDSTLLRDLRARALPVLIEMARWRSQQHAVPSLVILGRIGGMSEDAIAAAVIRGDRQAIIAASVERVESGEWRVESGE
jgi:hypothetical protein